MYLIQIEITNIYCIHQIGQNIRGIIEHVITNKAYLSVLFIKLFKVKHKRYIVV